MTRCSLKQGAYCITGILGDTDVPQEPFVASTFRGLSPLWWRVPILLWSLIVLFWSMSFFWGPTEKFFLYMTHWGLLFVVVESVFGILVTVKKPHGRQSDATFGLPWFVKTYWVLYNITIPVAFLITVFYWGVLKASTNIVNYAPNPVLDIMVHGVNSAVMVVELVCSAHPSRLLHIMQPLYFAGAYMLFTVVYYFAGGTDPAERTVAPPPSNSIGCCKLTFDLSIIDKIIDADYNLRSEGHITQRWGNPFIYPVVDWSKPDQTMVVITLTALFLALMHLLTVAIATARDAIVRRRLRDTTGVYNDGFGA